jgi:soluble lytic murein transglycosylase-like protein
MAMRAQTSLNSVAAVTLFAVLFVSRTALAQDAPTDISTSAWVAAAKKYRVDVLDLYSLALRESSLKRSDGAVRAWPWTLCTPQTGALYFESYEAALAKLTELIAQGTRNIDIGLMQVNWRWNGHRLPDPKRLLLPAPNIEIAAQILRENLDAFDGDLRLAIARYHNPRSELGIPYAASVLTIREYLRNNRNIEQSLQR